MLYGVCAHIDFHGHYMQPNAKANDCDVWWIWNYGWQNNELGLPLITPSELIDAFSLYDERWGNDAICWRSVAGKINAHENKMENVFTTR